MASLDAQILRTPARALQSAASRAEPGGFWTGLRRPLLLTFILGCVVSLGTTGVFTLRLVLPTAIYWSYVPITETIALVMVAWTRRRRVAWSRAIDAFFAGHALWTLYLVVLCWALASMPPERMWFWLTTWCLVGLAGVIGWSAYIDFCFYRAFYGAGRGAALRDVLIQRLIAWMLIFGVFAAEGATPWAVVEEIVRALQELFR